MRVEIEPRVVRRLVLQNFAQLGARARGLFDLEENILIHDGRYTARSYRIDDLMAMWLIDVGLVQFYDDDGEMLKTINLTTELEPLRMAA